MNYLKQKKILAIVCVICQIALLFSFNFTVSADTDYQAITNKLTNFGLFNNEDQMEKSDEILSRESLALILSDFCGIDRNSTYPTTGKFSDVDTTSATAGIIELMGNSGIIASYSDGLFRPSNPVTFGVAVKALINIAGYTPIANLKGGWPNGYIDQAAELGITDGVYKQYNDTITKGEFSTMLFNFLSVDMMRTTIMSSTGTSKYEILEGRTIASEKLNLFDAEGILSATDLTSLSGNEYAGVGRVIVNGVIYETDQNLSDFLGEYVEVYYIKGIDDEFGTIVNIESIGKKNNVVVVQDEDISDATTVEEFIYATGKNTKTLNIAPDATMIFNGVRKALFTEADLKPKNGSVKLIDSNKDNVYDVVAVTHFFDYVVNNASLDDTLLVVSDQAGKASVAIDITDKTRIAVYKNGVKDSLASAKKGTVVSVAADQMDLSNKTIGANSVNVVINISDTVASGIISGFTGQKPVMVNGVLSHYEYETITIGDVEYDFSPEYDFKNGKPTLGVSGTAAISYKGQVASITKEAQFEYGFLIDAAAEGGLDSTFRVKMYTSDKKFLTMNILDSLKIDGKKYTDPEKMMERILLGSSKFSADTGVSFANGNTRAQIVKFKKDLDKNLIELDTVLRGENETDDSLTWSINIGKGGNKFGGAGTFVSTTDGRRAVYGYDASTLMFKIPSDVTNESAYDMLTKSTWTGETQNYDLKIFDMDKFNYAPVLFVQSDVAGAKKVDENEITNMAIVTDAYKGLNKDGDTVDIIKAISLKAGTNIELLVPADVMENKVVHKGTIVRWEGNAEDPSAFEVTASVVDGVLSGERISATTPSSSYYAGFRITYGTVVEMSNDKMLLRVNYIVDNVETPALQATPLGNLTKIYDIDTDSSNDRAIVSTVSKNNIKAERDFGDDASKILLVYEYGKPFAAVIYR